MENFIFIVCHIIMAACGLGVFITAKGRRLKTRKNKVRVITKPKTALLTNEIRSEIRQEFGLNVYCGQLFL